MTINVYKLERDLVMWLSTASDRIRQSMLDPLQVNTKSNRNDLVTNVDKQTEAFYVQQIRSAYPQAKICGEEGLGDTIDSLDGLVFFVDPIDGTMNFVRQRAHFATMIGVFWNGKPLTGAIMDVMAHQLLVGGPQTAVTLNGRTLSQLGTPTLASGLIGINSSLFAQDAYHLQKLIEASSGARMTGSAGIEFMQVIMKEQIGYISQLSPWDVAAGWAIGAGLGLEVRNLAGELPALREREVIIAGVPIIWSQFKKLNS